MNYPNKKTGAQQSYESQPSYQEQGYNDSQKREGNNRTEWIDNISKCIDEGMTKSTLLEIEKKVDGSFKKITTSKLRKFFSAVKLLQQKGIEKNPNELIMLKPKLAYAVGRDKKSSELKEFYDLMSNVIDNLYDKITNPEDRQKNVKYTKNFSDLFETIVAYHKLKVVKDN